MKAKPKEDTSFCRSDSGGYYVRDLHAAKLKVARIKDKLVSESSSVADYRNRYTMYGSGINYEPPAWEPQGHEWYIAQTDAIATLTELIHEIESDLDRQRQNWLYPPPWLKKADA